MAITRIELSEFLVFNGEFSVDFSEGINVLIGENGTGKTTLMKAMYAACNFTNHYNGESKPFIPNPNNCSINRFFGNSIQEMSNMMISVFANGKKFFLCPCNSIDGINSLSINIASVYIPEKDMLSNSKGIPESYEYGKAEYTQCEVDIIKKARVLPNSPEQPLYRKICDIIKGEPQNDGQSFFMKRPNIDKPIPYMLEASGYRKWGLLATLIRNEQIRPGCVIFWDEPENSLNPEYMPQFVEILLELSQNGVQLFLATHSEILASYINTLQKNNDKVMFYSLYKDNRNRTIKYDNSERFDLLKPNKLTEEPVKLYEKKLDRGFGNG